MKARSFMVMVLMLAFSAGVMAHTAEEIIVEVLKAENEAFDKGTFDEWAGFWVQEEYASYSVGRAGFYTKVHSWDSIQANLQARFDGDRLVNDVTVNTYDVVILGNTALVTTQETAQISWMGQDMTTERTVKYLMEKKVGDTWKVVTADFIFTSSFEPSLQNAEMALNTSGYYFLGAGDLDKSIELLQLNTRYFPESANTWDSLAEAYMEKGDTKKAIKYYEKSLTLFPDNENAKKMIEKMKAK